MTYDEPHHRAARSLTAVEAVATGRCGDQHWDDMVCELDEGHDGSHRSISRHHVWTSTTPAQARAALDAWNQLSPAEQNAVTAKMVDRAQRRATLNRLRPTMTADERARADATVAHFRAAQDGSGDATA